MKTRSQKLQLKLTIQFALFFVIIAGFIFFYFTNKFEEQVNDKYQYKASVFVNFFTQNPQIFIDRKFTDTEIITRLLKLHNALYLVVENPSGELLYPLNLKIKKKSFYILAKSDDNRISKDEKVYRVELPIKTEEASGKIYVGFESGDDAKGLFKNKLLTALFSLTILMAGIDFT